MIDRLEIIWKYYSDVCMEGVRKTIKILSQDSQCSSRDLNQAPPEYKSRRYYNPSSLSVNTSEDVAAVCVCVCVCVSPLYRC
jgi:hypothetical protein